MTKPISPAEPNRASAPQANGSQPPAALRRRGIQTVTENCAADDRLRSGDLLWRYFGSDLYREFYS